MTLDPYRQEGIAAVVDDVLTPRQLETWRLYEMGRSMREIALAQGVTRQTVSGCLRCVALKLHRAGLRRKHNGQWYTKGANGAKHH